MAGELETIPTTPSIPMRQAPQLRPQQEQQPADPSEFFHVGPGIPANQPEYQQDRDLWWKDFTDGYHNQNFRNVNDYIEFVEGLSLYPEINAFAKQQALKFMPPKLKAEYESLQAEKKEERQWDKTRNRIQQFNTDPENRKLGVIMDPTGKMQALKTDPELDRWKQQAELYNKIIKSTLDAISKLKAGELGGEQKAGESQQFARKTRRDQLQVGLEDQLPALYEKLSEVHANMMGVSAGKQMGPEIEAEEQAAAQEEEQVAATQTPADVLQAVRAGTMTREEAMAIGQQMGWK